MVLYHYIVLRNELPDGVQLAQTVHAAGESSLLRLDGSLRTGRLPANTHAVVLAETAKTPLEALEAQLRAAGIAHAAIREPDAPYLGQLLAIGAAPAPRKQVGRFFKGLPLAGRRNR